MRTVTSRSPASTTSPRTRRFAFGAKRDAAADDAAEVLRRAQRPLDAGRRDRDLPLAPIVGEEVGHARAELVVDTAHVVDVHGEPVGLRELDGEHLRLRKCGLDLACDLARQILLFLVCCGQLFCCCSMPRSQKMGAARPFRYCSKCGVTRIASRAADSCRAGPSAAARERALRVLATTRAPRRSARPRDRHGRQPMARPRAERRRPASAPQASRRRHQRDRGERDAATLAPIAAADERCSAIRVARTAAPSRRRSCVHDARSPQLRRLARPAAATRSRPGSRRSRSRPLRSGRAKTAEAAVERLVLRGGRSSSRRRRRSPSGDGAKSRDRSRKRSLRRCRTMKNTTTAMPPSTYIASFASAQTSRTIVTGPSFTSSTCILAPKTPVSTGTPSSRSVRAEALVERLGRPPDAPRRRTTDGCPSPCPRSA